MFHSGEEYDRNVDLLNELEHLYNTAESNEATNPTNSFELDQIIPDDFSSFEFDFVGDSERRDASGNQSTTSHSADELQYSTTFTTEDKWPI